MLRKQLLYITKRLKFLGSSVVVTSVERGWRTTQITSPWNIKGAVPTKRSHDEEKLLAVRLNSLRENSSTSKQLGGDNLKALPEEECISIWNGRYVVCPTFESLDRKQLDYAARLKRSIYSRANNDEVRLSENMTNFLRKLQNHLQELSSVIDTRLKADEERTKYKVINDRFKFLKSMGIELDVQKKRSKRHDSHYYSNSDDWIYQPQGYVIYNFNVPMILVPWPAFPPDYEPQIYNTFSKNSRHRHQKKYRINHNGEHKQHNIHDYRDEQRDSEEYEDYTNQRDNNNVSPTRPTNAPLSHMLQHIYPPWPMNKTNQ